MNCAGVTAYPSGHRILWTGSQARGTGAFTGGGTGNKAICGIFGFDGLPLSLLTSLTVTWQNITGKAGPHYNPAEPATTVTPYLNLLVDFNPAGPSDRRILVVCSDGLNPLISNAIGTYSNPGGLNTLTYSWSSSQSVQIVNAPPNAVPGLVTPSVSVAPTTDWRNNCYSFSALSAANPLAVLRDCWPNDGGLPVGQIVPSILLCSGDSGTFEKSGKLILSMAVNGSSVFP